MKYEKQKHNMVEKRRSEKIRRKFDELYELLNFGIVNKRKLTKYDILNESINHINLLSIENELLKYEIHNYKMRLVNEKILTL